MSFVSGTICAFRFRGAVCQVLPCWAEVCLPRSSGQETGENREQACHRPVVKSTAAHGVGDAGLGWLTLLTRPARTAADIAGNARDSATGGVDRFACSVSSGRGHDCGDAIWRQGTSLRAFSTKVLDVASAVRRRRHLRHQ